MMIRHQAISQLCKGLFDFAFPAEWVKAALVLSFFSTMVVIGVFWYLNRFTKKPYFSIWTAGWMFFALWLMAAIQLEESPQAPFAVWVRQACIGICALCMSWGSFEMTGAWQRTRRELAGGILFLLLWSYYAAYHASAPWVTLPLFGLLATASIYTGSLYFRMRHRYSGAGMLATGFIAFGTLLFCRPFIESGPPLMLTINYLVTSVLGIFIALGMVVQVLEQGREQNETLVVEFKRGMAARRLLEQEVSVSEQKYQALFDSASDAIFLVDLETLNILEANAASAHFLGDNPSARTGRQNFADLCPSLRGMDGTLLQNKRVFDDVFGPSKEFLMTRPNGTAVVCEGSANLVQYNQRPVLQLNIREITERKRLEQQLHQSEKLSALGQLVAGVAHELNNPLAVIMGYSQILSKQTGDDPKLKGDVVKILRESERAAKIVRNLLTFARPHDPQMTTVNLNRLLANVLETHAAEFEVNGIALRQQLQPDLPSTVADPHQLEQVFTNILLNALQVLQDQQGPRVIEVTTELHERTLRVMFTDSGPGIAPEIINRIFDPFFTTKPPGKGTGLGLSISHSIIHEHRGKIWVQSEGGKGAKFFIELPMVARTAPEAEPSTLTPANSPAHSKRLAAYRLLLVDDEPGILEVLATVLGESGFTVDTAANGNQALEQISQHRYDLIVSDLCMPGVDGEALYKRLRESDPELAGRIVFLTGDTVSTKSRTFLEWTGNRWFSKPFSTAELEEVITNFVCGRTEVVGATQN
jgi:PAS domain S-box-containing protein